MAGVGGYQPPAQPAPVSGPGALSRRTDGGPGQPVRPISGLGYGENQELNTLQGQATMAQAAPAGTQQTVPPEVGLSDMSPNLFDQTNHPDRPVTTGMPFGPGVGSEALGSPVESRMAQQKMLSALPTLLRAAERPDVTPEFRSLVALMRSQILG